MQALEATNDRIDTLERLQRMNAQATNHFDESLRGLNLRMTDIGTDITDFRSSVSTAHSNMDRVISDRLAALQSQIDALTGVLSSMPPPDSIERRVLTIEQTIADMNRRLPPPIAPGTQPSQGTFGIGTPIGVELPIPTMANSGPQPVTNLDPWHTAAYSLGQRQLREERAQQDAAPASEPSRHLNTEHPAIRQVQSSPPIHTHTPTLHV